MDRSFCLGKIYVKNEEFSSIASVHQHHETRFFLHHRIISFFDLIM